MKWISEVGGDLGPDRPSSGFHADGVTTFDPADPAQDVVDRLKAAGTRDPKPALPGARTTAHTLDLAPGHTQTLAKATTPGLLTALDITLPQASYVTPRTETDNGRAFGKGGSSEFTVAVDPANEGVTLTRRLDPGIGHQVADVYVDGSLAGRWSPNEPVGGGLWAEQSVRLPASLTAGKSRITVKNVFVSSHLDYNEFTYWADSETGARPTAPTPSTSAHPPPNRTTRTGSPRPPGRAYAPSAIRSTTTSAPGSPRRRNFCRVCACASPSTAAAPSTRPWASSSAPDTLSRPSGP